MAPQKPNKLRLLPSDHELINHADSEVLLCEVKLGNRDAKEHEHRNEPFSDNDLLIRVDLLARVGVELEHLHLLHQLEEVDNREDDWSHDDGLKEGRVVQQGELEELKIHAVVLQVRPRDFEPRGQHAPIAQRD